jgi:hypothetical protein
LLIFGCDRRFGEKGRSLCSGGEGGSLFCVHSSEAVIVCAIGGLVVFQDERERIAGEDANTAPDLLTSGLKAKFLQGEGLRGSLEDAAAAAEGTERVIWVKNFVLRRDYMTKRRDGQGHERNLVATKDEHYIAAQRRVHVAGHWIIK